MKKFLNPEFEYLKLTLRDVICESTDSIDGDNGMIDETESLPGEEDEGFGEE